jgi:hypothetical protein
VHRCTTLGGRLASPPPPSLSPRPATPALAAGFVLAPIARRAQSPRPAAAPALAPARHTHHLAPTAPCRLRSGLRSTELKRYDPLGSGSKKDRYWGSTSFRKDPSRPVPPTPGGSFWERPSPVPRRPGSRPGPPTHLATTVPRAHRTGPRSRARRATGSGPKPHHGSAQPPRPAAALALAEHRLWPLSLAPAEVARRERAAKIGSYIAFDRTLSPSSPHAGPRRAPDEAP